jgi:hypothetical protein
MKDALLLVIGALISVWTGIATARFLAFRECVRSAAQSVVDFPFELARMDSLWNAEITVRTFLSDQPLTLIFYGNFRAGERLMAVRDQYRATCLKELQLAREQLHLTPAETVGDKWREVMAIATPEMLKSGRSSFTPIFDLGPDWSAVLFGAWVSLRLTHAHEFYSDLSEHLETGQSLVEIRRRRDRDADKD